MILPPLGEWDGPTLWDNGNPADPLPLPVVVGNTDCIMLGELPPPEPFEGEPAFTTESFPRACFESSQPQVLAFDIEECNTVVPFAQVLYQLPLNVTAAASLLSSLLGPEYTLSTVPNSASTVPGTIIAVGPRVLVFVTGTSNFQQLAAQVLYLGTGFTNFGSFSCLLVVLNAAIAIEARITAAGAAAKNEFWFIGHSYGGAVCQVMAARMRVNTPDKAVNLVTYGSPAAGDARLVELLAGTRQRHFVNDDDPIPGLPVRHFNLDEIAFYLGIPLTTLWGQLALPRFRMILFADGTFFDSQNDVLEPSVFIAIAKLVNAVTALPTFNVHLMDEYVFRLELSCSGPLPPPPFLNFHVIIDSISWDDASLIYTVSFDLTLTPSVFPAQWTGTQGDGQIVEIAGTLDDDGNYQEFRIFHLPNRYLPFTNNFLWRFPGGMVGQGIDTVIFPSPGFANPNVFVVSLVRLRVIPIFAP